MDVDWSDLMERLAEPFPAELVEFRAGSTSRDKKTAMALAYVDMREYQKRLDAVVGPDWESTFIPWGEKQVICQLTIHGRVRSSTGNGDSKDVETGTTAEAQAFKRACVAWGLGRYLYEMPAPWVAYDEDKKRLLEKPKIPAKFLPPPSKPSPKPEAASRASQRTTEAPVRMGKQQVEPIEDAADEDIFDGGDFLNNEEAQNLHRRIGAMLPLSDDKAFASHVLKRPLESFTQVKKAEEEKLIAAAKLFVEREPWRGWRNKDDAQIYAAKNYGRNLKAGEHINTWDTLAEQYEGKDLMRAYYEALEQLAMSEAA